MRILLSVTIKGDIVYCKSLSKYIKNYATKNKKKIAKLIANGIG